MAKRPTNRSIPYSRPGTPQENRGNKNPTPNKLVKSPPAPPKKD